MIIKENKNLKPENLYIVRYKGVDHNPVYSQAFYFGESILSKKKSSKFKRKVRLCGCGCGKRVTKNKRNPKKWNKYSMGHDSRTINPFVEKPPESKAPLCKCGCKERVKWNQNYKNWNKYIIGHWARTIIINPDYENQPLCTCGCKKKTKWCSGRKKWNKYILGHENKGNDKWKKEKEKGAPLCKCGCGKKVNWSKQYRKYNTYIGQHHRRGYKNSQESKDKLSISISGKNNPRWKGGKSFEPYCCVWADQEYKQDIKDRDDNKCQSLDCWGRCNHLPLNIHHINYIKKDCHPKNLITLCVSCNSRANSNKDYWQEFYQNIISNKYGYI